MEIFLDDNLGVKSAVKFERTQTSYYLDMETINSIWKCRRFSGWRFGKQCDLPLKVIMIWKSPEDFFISWTSWAIIPLPSLTRFVQTEVRTAIMTGSLLTGGWRFSVYPTTGQRINPIHGSQLGDNFFSTWFILSSVSHLLTFHFIILNTVESIEDRTNPFVFTYALKLIDPLFKYTWPDYI